MVSPFSTQTLLYTEKFHTVKHYLQLSALVVDNSHAAKQQCVMTQSDTIGIVNNANQDRRASARAQRMSLFAHAFLANGRNATAAAIAAGYSTASARSAGSRLLKTATVRAVVDAADATIQRINGVSEQTIRDELALLAFAPVGPGVKASDKNKALDSLARMEGLFKEAEEVQRFSYADRLQRALDRKRQRQVEDP